MKTQFFSHVLHLSWNFFSKISRQTEEILQTDVFEFLPAVAQSSSLAADVGEQQQETSASVCSARSFHMSSLTNSTAAAVRLSSQLASVGREKKKKKVCISADINLTFSMCLQQQRVPLRWYPPEYFKSHFYSFKGDVWAFGIVLWEMQTFGESEARI